MISEPPQWVPNDGRCLSLGLGKDRRNEAGCHSKARTEAKDNGSYGWLHPSCLHSHQTMDSRVIGAQCQLHYQCLQCLRGWEDPGIHIMADIHGGNLEAIWRPTCQSLKTRMPRMPLPTKVGTGTWQCIIALGAEVVPSSPCHPFVTRLPREASEKFRDGHYPGQPPHHIGQTQ